jgi:hypothetical protein
LPVAARRWVSDRNRISASADDDAALSRHAHFFEEASQDPFFFGSSSYARVTARRQVPVRWRLVCVDLAIEDKAPST